MANTEEISALAATLMPGFTITPANRRVLAHSLWCRTDGKGWTPPEHNSLIADLVTAGYLRPSTLADGGVLWTEAGAEIARQPIVRCAGSSDR